MERLEYLIRVFPGNTYNPDNLLIKLENGYMTPLTEFLKVRNYEVTGKFRCISVTNNGNIILYTFETIESKKMVWVTVEKSNSYVSGASVL